MDRERATQQFQPIETTDPHEYDIKFIDQLKGLMFFYAEKQSEKHPDLDFAHILHSTTPLYNELQDRYNVANQDDLDSNFEKYLNELAVSINEAYKNRKNGWEEEVLKIIKSEEEKFPYPPSNTTEQKRDHEEKCGILKYNTRTGVWWFKEAGYDNKDDFIDVHFESLVLKGKEKIDPNEILESFKKLAGTIVDKYPQTRAITGTSWLLSHPLVEKLGGFGFHILKNDLPQNGLYTWLQFMDRNGKISQKRVNQLLETGEIPVQAKTAYIPVEEFLQTYLPQERRGEITLKEVDQEWKNTTEQLTKEDHKLRDDWKDGKITNLKKFLSELPTIQKIFEKAGIWNDFVNILTAAYEAKLKWEEIRNNYHEQLASMPKKIEDILESDKYLIKKIIIN